MLQNGPTKPNDAIDLLIESVQHVVEGEDDNGQRIKSIEPDNESLWFKMQLVNAPFSKFVLKLRFFYDLAANAEYNMCEERAKVLKDQIINIYKSYKYSIDAKSSETLRDKHNTQSSAFHILTDKSIDKKLTISGDKVKSRFGDMMMGREPQDEPNY